MMSLDDLAVHTNSKRELQTEGHTFFYIAALFQPFTLVCSHFTLPSVGETVKSTKLIPSQCHGKTMTSNVSHTKPFTQLTATLLVELRGVSLLPKVCSALTFTMLYQKQFHMEFNNRSALNSTKSTNMLVARSMLQITSHIQKCTLTERRDAIQMFLLLTILYMKTVWKSRIPNKSHSKS